MRGHALRCAAAASLAVFSGCASTLSGVGGEQGYGCQAPAGTTCTSVSGVYANTSSGARGGFAAPSAIADSAGVRSVPGRDVAMTIETRAASASADPPIRSVPKVMRLWIAPWEDTDGDLNEASVVHVLIDQGRWLIEHVRPISTLRIDAVAPPAAIPARVAPTHDAARSSHDANSAEAGSVTPTLPIAPARPHPTPR